MYGNVYVQFTSTQLRDARDAFERRALLFSSDYRMRRIEEIAKTARGSWPFARKSAELPWSEAEMIFNDRDDEQYNYKKVKDGLNAYRAIISEAEKAPIGTIFQLTMEDARWFRPFSANETIALQYAKV